MSPPAPPPPPVPTASHGTPQFPGREALAGQPGGPRPPAARGPDQEQEPVRRQPVWPQGRHVHTRCRGQEDGPCPLRSHWPMGGARPRRTSREQSCREAPCQLGAVRGTMSVHAVPRAARDGPRHTRTSAGRRCCRSPPPRGCVPGARRRGARGQAGASHTPQSPAAFPVYRAGAGVAQAGPRGCRTRRAAFAALPGPFRAPLDVSGLLWVGLCLVGGRGPQ